VIDPELSSIYNTQTFPPLKAIETLVEGLLSSNDIAFIDVIVPATNGIIL
jgi:hypothetical protein